MAGVKTGKIDRLRLSQAIRPLNEWDVSKVRLFQGMFHQCDRFNQDLSSWDTSSAENMGDMFREALAFNRAPSGGRIRDRVGARAAPADLPSATQPCEQNRWARGTSFWGHVDARASARPLPTLSLAQAIEAVVTDSALDQVAAR